MVSALDFHGKDHGSTPRRPGRGGLQGGPVGGAFVGTVGARKGIVFLICPWGWNLNTSPNQNQFLLDDTLQEEGLPSDAAPSCDGRR